MYRKVQNQLPHLYLLFSPLKIQERYFILCETPQNHTLGGWVSFGNFHKER